MGMRLFRYGSQRRRRAFVWCFLCLLVAIPGLLFPEPVASSTNIRTVIPTDTNAESAFVVSSSPDRDPQDTFALRILSLEHIERYTNPRVGVRVRYRVPAEVDSDLMLSGKFLSNSVDVGFTIKIPAFLGGDTGEATVEVERSPESIDAVPYTDAIRLAVKREDGDTVLFSRSFQRPVDWTGTYRDAITDTNVDAFRAIHDLRERLASGERFTLSDPAVNRFFDLVEFVGEPGNYRWFFRTVTDRYSDQLTSDDLLYEASLRSLVKADRTLGLSDETVREYAGRLFETDQFVQPVKGGPLTGSQFRSLRTLFDRLGFEGKLSELSVPNVRTYRADRSTVRLRKYGNQPLFFAFPEGYFLESVRVRRRPLTRLGPHRSEIFKEIMFSGGLSAGGWHQLTFHGDREAINRRNNPFSTQTYNLVFRAENPSWLAVDPVVPSSKPFNLKLDFTAFKLSSRDTGFPDQNRAPISSVELPAGVGDLRRRVEWALTADRADSALQQLSRSDVSADYQRLLESVLRRRLDRAEEMNESLRKISNPASPSVVYLAKFYDLLPGLHRPNPGRYLTSSDTEKLRALRSGGKSDARIERLREFSRSKLLWRTGRFLKAARGFERLPERMKADHPLWHDSVLYHVSSLARSGADELAVRRLKSYLVATSRSQQEKLPRFYVDTEGHSLNGHPYRLYLGHWLSALEESRIDWWYETIGENRRDLAYYHIFSNEKSASPVTAFLARVFQRGTGSHYGYMNHKGGRSGLEAGPIRRHELFAVLPWSESLKIVPRESDDDTSAGSFSPPETIRRSDPVARCSSNSVASQGGGPERVTNSSMALPAFVFARSFHPNDNSLPSYRNFPLSTRDLLERYVRKNSPIRFDPRSCSARERGTRRP